MRQKNRFYTFIHFEFDRLKASLTCSAPTHQAIGDIGINEAVIELPKCIERSIVLQFFLVSTSFLIDSY